MQEGRRVANAVDEKYSASDALRSIRQHRMPATPGVEEGFERHAGPAPCQ
jgi:hypothetical protein